MDTGLRGLERVKSEKPIPQPPARVRHLISGMLVSTSLFPVLPPWFVVGLDDKRQSVQLGEIALGRGEGDVKESGFLFAGNARIVSCQL